MSADHGTSAAIEIIPVLGLGEFRPGDDVAAAIAAAADWLRDDDVVVVTSKVLSKAEGRIVAAPTDPEQRDTLRRKLIDDEAVRVLAHARVLDVRRGDGTYVTSLEPSLLLSGLSFVTDLMQGPTLLEVFEVRRLLEPAATALAAERIGPEQIDGTPTTHYAASLDFAQARRYAADPRTAAVTMARPVVLP